MVWESFQWLLFYMEELSVRGQPVANNLDRYMKYVRGLIYYIYLLIYYILFGTEFFQNSSSSERAELTLG